MKLRFLTLLLLLLTAGISCKEKIILKKEQASFIPIILEDQNIHFSLGSELLQAKKSGILSDYQFSFWAGAYGMIVRKGVIGDKNILEEIKGSYWDYDGISYFERNEYPGSDWVYYENQAYNGDWELSLWHLAE